MADSKYVTLVSKEGFEFVCLREATLVSPTMKGMLRGHFAEARTGRCTFPEMRYGFPSFPSSHPSLSAMMTHALCLPTDRSPPFLNTHSLSRRGTRDRTA